MGGARRVEGDNGSKEVSAEPNPASLTPFCTWVCRRGGYVFEGALCELTKADQDFGGGSRVAGLGIADCTDGEEVDVERGICR
jgi:hypothetical protein